MFASCFYEGGDSSSSTYKAGVGMLLEETIQDSPPIYLSLCKQREEK